MSNKKRTLRQATELLDVFARNITNDAAQISVAKKHGLPLYEVVAGNTTLDLTRHLKEANELFHKYNTIKIFKVIGGLKTLYRAKQSGKIGMGRISVTMMPGT